MGRPSRTFAVILLLTAAFTVPGVHGLAFTAPQASSESGSTHPGSCHAQGMNDRAPVAPPAAPASYQCCAGAHHPAMTSAGFAQKPLASSIALTAGEVSSDVYVSFSSLIQPATDSPPLITALRV